MDALVTMLVLLVPSADVDGARDRWALRWEPGRPVRYRFTEENTIDDQGDQQAAIQTVTTSWLRIDPQAISNEERRAIVRFDRVTLSIDGPGSKLSLDTEQRPRRSEQAELARYRELVGRDFLVVFGPSGDVLSIESTGSDKEDAIVIDARRAQLRRLLSSLSSWMPVEKGPSVRRWRRQESIPTGLMEFSRSVTYEASQLDEQRLRVVGRARWSSRPTEATTEEGDTIIASIQAFEPGERAIVFHQTTGQVESIDSSASFTMNLTRRTPGPNPTAIQSSQRLSARLSVVRLPNEETALAN